MYRTGFNHKNEILLLDDLESQGILLVPDEMVAKIITALNFYEQAHTEYRCSVCGSNLETQPVGSQTYVCQDANACMTRYNNANMHG